MNEHIALILQRQHALRGTTDAQLAVMRHETTVHQPSSSAMREAHATRLLIDDEIKRRAVGVDGGRGRGRPR